MTQEVKNYLAEFQNVHLRLRFTTRQLRPGMEEIRSGAIEISPHFGPKVRKLKMGGSSGQATTAGNQEIAKLGVEAAG